MKQFLNAAGWRRSRIRSAVLSVGLASTVVIVAACGDESAVAPGGSARWTLTAEEGNAQRGTTNTFLDGELVVRLVTANGEPLAGRTVTWSTGIESGAIEAVAYATDAQGFATARWRLGESEQQSASADIEGAEPVRFTATAVGFGLDCWPDSVAHRIGEWRATLCGVNAVGGFEGDVQLSLSVPAEIEWNLAESMLTVSDSAPSPSTIGIIRIGDIAPGTYPLAVDAVSGSVTSRDTVLLTVE